MLRALLVVATFLVISCGGGVKETCPSGSQRCGADCAVIARDPVNCGACGIVCGAGTVCSNGACALSCVPAQQSCPGTGDAGYCADLARDPNNCGACSVTCFAGQLCEVATGETTASCSCPASKPNTCGAAPDSFCTDLLTDPVNCGACSVACGAGTVCSNGACALSCVPSQQPCPGAGDVGYCADLVHDPNNCGACGLACPSGQLCAVATGDVSASCGCPAAKPDACGAGADAFCTDLQVDPDNCGACGGPCGAGQKCEAGLCLAADCPGATLCGATCTDLQTDPLNCGSCGNACPAGAGDVARCTAATCATSCAAGWVDVDGDSANGCECQILPGDDLPDLAFTDGNCDGIDGDLTTAVFVAPTGNDLWPGTAQLPKKTLASAIATAGARPVKAPVLVSAGTYAGPVTLAAGVSLYGGYDAAAGWSRGWSNSTVILGGSPAVTATSILGPIELQLFEVRPDAGVAPGSSSIGLWISDVIAPVTLRALTVIASAGANGTAGASGATSTTCGSYGGPGGNGGYGTGSGQQGQRGGPMGYGGYGGSGGYGAYVGCGGGTPGSGGSGLPGPSGGNGSNGATSTGLVTASGFAPGNGGAGAIGAAGYGGGGGGGGGGRYYSCWGSSSSSGGGGGAGGVGHCGAVAGTGGTGGGASFAIVTRNSAVLVDQSTLMTALGGSGGNGGDGAVGGDGGPGLAGSTGASGSTGGTGGNGGSGGASGAGAGGSGGPSWCVARVGGNVILEPSVACTPGLGGAGGPGGTAPVAGAAPTGAAGDSGVLRTY